jgi:hypothetical protein
MSGLISTEYFPSFQDSEDFYQKITHEEGAGGRVLRQLLLSSLLAFLYGIVMGSYHGVAQALAAGVKLSILFALALLICFPALFIIQTILGSKLRLLPMISVILSGFVLAAAVMVSFTPIVIIFLLTGSNYYFLQLLHIAIVAISGAFGMKTVIDALKYACEQRRVYPQTGVVVFRFWLVILAFVGIQLAWNFRPFLGDRGQPFQLFREYEGNFYTAVIYSVGQLVRSDVEEQPVIRWEDVEAQPALPDTSSTSLNIRDSLFGN